MRAVRGRTWPALAAALVGLRRVSLPYVRAHKLRTLLTVLGVALGATAIVAIRVTHESVNRGYARTVDRIAGRAVLQVTNGDAGVPEELLAEVAAVPGVTAAGASVQGFATVVDRGERLYVLGVDLLADQALRRYELDDGEATVEDPLVFLAQPSSVALTTEQLGRWRLQVGDAIRVRSPAGPAELVVRAAFRGDTGPTSLFDGRIAVMDVFAAQRLLGLAGRFTEIDVGVGPETDVAAVEAALTAVVAGRGAVERPAARSRGLERLLASNRYASTLAGALAVTVGLYVVFNTLVIAGVQRRRELGVLRAIGLRRRDVRRLVVVEAVLLGLAGAAIGVPLGALLARTLSAAFAHSVSTLYLPVDTEDVPLGLGPALWGIGLAVASAVVAALVPARRMAALAPREVLSGRTAEPAAGGEWRLAAAGAAVGLGVLTLWMLRVRLGLAASTLATLVIVALLFGSSLLIPVLVPGFAAAMRRVLVRLRGELAGYASANLARHRAHVGITAATFLVSLAGAIVVASWLSSLERTLGSWLDALFSRIDLVLAAGTDPLSSPTPLPESLAAEVAALPGVARVDAIRVVEVAYDGLVTKLVAGDMGLFSEGLRTLDVIQGDAPQAVAALVRGEAVVVNEPFARRFGRWRGDVVTLASPSGPVRLPIAAVYLDLSFADVGVIQMDRTLYRRLWRDHTVDFVEPVLAPGADRAGVMREIDVRFGERHALFVITTEQYRRDMQALLAQTTVVAYPLIVIAVGVALLGVVNALLATLVDRTRELATLRAVGATRAQVARLVMAEAALVGLLGGAAGVVVGSVLGRLETELLFRGVFGMTVLYRYPAAAVAFALVAAVGLTALTGYGVGRRAAGQTIVRGLAYE